MQTTAAQLHRQERLIQALRDPGLWPQGGQSVDVLETHISWVLLCGDYAYKIKKAVDLGFLDFSTLEKRRHFCQEELRLNGRLAPELYLDVVAISGSPEQPHIGVSGEPMEYAVKMIRFDQQALFTHIVERHGLRDRHVDQMAQTIAEFHERIPRATPDSPYGDPERVREPVEENFRQIRERASDRGQEQLLKPIHKWAEDQFARHRTSMRQRKNDGYVRECHGDMHLGNMAELDGQLVIFDGIEFNPWLYWIDVMNEVAFLCMDLEDHGYRHFAYRFLNGYLERTGDYDGLALLPYYLTYRAMVRAKVAAIRMQQETEHGNSPHARDELADYLTLARDYTLPRQPMLFITHGLSGSGKSTLSAPLAEHIPAIRIRSDRERQRLFGQSEGQTDIESGIYTAEATRKTYERLLELARTALTSGYSVIVDATFLTRQQRRPFQDLANRLIYQFFVLDFRATPETLRERIRARTAAGTDVSEADLRVLEHQLETDTGLDPDEKVHTITIDTETITNASDIIQRIRSATASAGAPAK